MMCSAISAPAAAVLSLSISTAAGEMTFPVRGSSNRAALIIFALLDALANSDNAAKMVRLILTIMALYGIEQLFRVVSSAVFEDDFNVFDIRNVSGRIAFYHDEVGILSNGDRSNLFLTSEKNRAVQSGDVNCLNG